jgi:hypothetical protein
LSPVSTPFPGLVVAFGGQHLLLFGPDAAAFGEPLFGPPAFLRPAYRLYDGGNYLLPAEAIDDIGQRFRGLEALAWIEARGDLFPRADVIGVLPSGQPKSAFMKEIDLADLAVYAAPGDGGRPLLRLALALEARAVPDGDALTPITCPPELQPFERAMPCYRLSPGAFGALGAGLIRHLLLTGRRDLRLTFDQLDDLLPS